jgi:hypothetical protein
MLFLIVARLGAQPFSGFRVGHLFHIRPHRLQLSNFPAVVSAVNDGEEIRLGIPNLPNTHAS